MVVRLRWLGLAVAIAGMVFAERASAQEGDGATSPEAEAERGEKTTARTSDGYPIRWARRPLVLQRGMLRADGRVYVGGTFASGTLSSIDVGGALSPVENLEIGISSQRIGTVPATAGNGMLTVIMSPRARYGDIPVYARYQFHESDVLAVGVDVVLSLPANTDFRLTANVPLRIFEIFGLFTMDMNTGFTLVAGDSYGELTPEPSNVTFDVDWGGAGTVNVTDHAFVQIGGGVSVVNLNGGPGVRAVVELPVFVGGGYTYESPRNLLVDFFLQTGFLPLMFGNPPPGLSSFEAGSTWFVAFGAQVYTEPLFAKGRARP